MNLKPPPPTTLRPRERPKSVKKTIQECNQEIEILKNQLLNLRLINKQLLVENKKLVEILQSQPRFLHPHSMVSESDYESAQKRLRDLYGGYLPILIHTIN